MKFKDLYEEKDGFFISQKVFFRLEKDPFDTVIFSNFQMWKTKNPGEHNNDYVLKFVKKVNPKDIKAEIPIKSEKDMIKLQQIDTGFTYNGEKYDLIGTASIIKSDMLPKNEGIWEM